jgi:hypothetical protein
MVNSTDTLDAAGFKLTVVEKPRARLTISEFGKPYWTVYLKSTVNWKRPIYGVGTKLEQAYEMYERHKNEAVSYLSDSYWDKYRNH